MAAFKADALFPDPDSRALVSLASIVSSLEDAMLEFTAPPWDNKICCRSLCESSRPARPMLWLLLSSMAPIKVPSCAIPGGALIGEDPNP